VLTRGLPDAIIRGFAQKSEVIRPPTRVEARLQVTAVGRNRQRRAQDWSLSAVVA